MKLHVTRDIAAPREEVFDRLADFERFEARARARGAEIRPLPGDARGWHVTFEWHGVRREVDLVVESFERPEGYAARLATTGLSGRSRVSLKALAGGGTRLSVACEIEATTFTGRMMMPTLAFARPALEGRLRRRLDELAGEIEAG